MRVGFHFDAVPIVDGNHTLICGIWERAVERNKDQTTQFRQVNTNTNKSMPVQQVKFMTRESFVPSEYSEDLDQLSHAYTHSRTSAIEVMVGKEQHCMTLP